MPTFKAVARKYYEENLPRWKPGRHTERWMQVVEKYAFPVFGDVPVDRVGREDVLRMLTPIWTSKPEYAGLRDKRLAQASGRCAPVDEVIALVERYQNGHRGWNVRHFYAWYRRAGGGRSYTWGKNTLQAAGAVTRASRRGAHRQRREAAPGPGMMLHQDGSCHEWVPGQRWDLIVTMDDATGEHSSMFLCRAEGAGSSFQGVREVIEAKGVFRALYTDRGSHDWHTPAAGGKVAKRNLTQFGRARAHLGGEMIPAYSPQARGRSERAFKTHQDRLVQELARAGIRDMAAANRYVREVYRPAFNAEFARPARAAGSAFVAWGDLDQLDAILCEHHERVVGHDNCVRFQRQILQIPPDQYRCHYVKAKVKVLQQPDGGLVIRHGPRELARYNAAGKLLTKSRPAAA